jgi:AbrB family looped-hinge helix DNA binding protein
MAVSTLTSKGQITIPGAIRKTLGATTGDRFDFRVRGDGVVEMKLEKTSILSLCGAVKPGVKGITLDDMKKAVGQGGESDGSR